MPDELVSSLSIVFTGMKTILWQRSLIGFRSQSRIGIGPTDVFGRVLLMTYNYDVLYREIGWT
jgi:hypothetical protein